MKKGFLAIAAMFLVVAMVAGCGSQVSETKPISEVKAEAQKMDVNQLKSTVAKYQKVVEAKKDDLMAVQAKLKAIPLTEMMGKDAGAIKKEIQSVTTAVRALTVRMQVYTAELNKKM